jgi:hypothetical protein
LAPQFRQLSIQLIFRNFFATVELIGTGSNLCLNRIPVTRNSSLEFETSRLWLPKTRLNHEKGSQPDLMPQLLEPDRT